ncbi:hypothetical protein FQN54_000148 [Arachnomyces sp. PD_36]|nr:hypothetical protein FQN54_000148 [Arachnomyces sp. PD_36]
MLIFVEIDQLKLKDRTTAGSLYRRSSPVNPTSANDGIFSRIPGPYASAILRFQIRFPPTYPDLPPLVTFSTDIFHPLLVPLTTYTFTTGAADTTDTVSATDEERLPPGGFSLRHGFPHWFGRARRSATNSAASSRNVSGNSPAPNASSTTASTNDGEESSQSEETVQPVTPKKPARDVDPPSASKTSSPAVTNLSSSTPVRAPSALPPGLQYYPTRRDVPALTLINYIRSTFDDESVLDSVPLEAAGNPGAWHAWRTHRRSVNSSGGTAENALRRSSSLRKASPQARLPGEWNWEGVWAQRVQNGIEASFSDGILFGNSPRGGGDDFIRFLNLDKETLASVKEKIVPKEEKEEEEEEALPVEAQE